MPVKLIPDPIWVPVKEFETLENIFAPVNAFMSANGVKVDTKVECDANVSWSAVLDAYNEVILVCAVVILASSVALEPCRLVIFVLIVVSFVVLDANNRLVLLSSSAVLDVCNEVTFVFTCINNILWLAIVASPVVLEFCNKVTVAFINRFEVVCDLIVALTQIWFVIIVVIFALLVFCYLSQKLNYYWL